MVVLSTVSKKSEVELYFNRYRDNPDSTYWQGHGVKAYKHNFTINIGDSSVYVGIHHNMKKAVQGSVDMVIKYNPNKVYGVELASIICQFFIGNPFTKVKSFDLAIDIPINILQVFPQPVGKMSKRIIDNGGDNKTYYFKERGSNGAIKIYNKKREAGLDYDLTRYEITLNPNVTLDGMSFYRLDEDLLIPMFITGDVQLGFDVTGTDKVLLLACLEHYEYLDELPRKKKAKIKEFIENLLCQVEINVEPLNKTVNSYFNNMLS